MSSNQLSEMYQLMTTNVLYKLDPAFDNMQLRSAISSSLISFNRTQVTLVNGYLIYMAYKLQLITNYNIPCILYQVWPVWTLGNEESSRLITKFGSLSVGYQYPFAWYFWIILWRRDIYDKSSVHQVYFSSIYIHLHSSLLF